LDALPVISTLVTMLVFTPVIRRMILVNLPQTWLEVQDGKKAAYDATRYAWRGITQENIEER